jgi:hypothetical protein
MSKGYNFCYLGGLSDGRMVQRHLSREEFFDFLNRIPKHNEPKPEIRTGEELRYELVDFRGGTFYFEWLKPK